MGGAHSVDIRPYGCFIYIFRFDSQQTSPAEGSRLQFTPSWWKTVSRGCVCTRSKGWLFMQKNSNAILTKDCLFRYATLKIKLFRVNHHLCVFSGIQTLLDLAQHWLIRASTKQTNMILYGTTKVIYHHCIHI